MEKTKTYLREVISRGGPANYTELSIVTDGVDGITAEKKTLLETGGVIAVRYFPLTELKLNPGGNTNGKRNKGKNV